MLVKIGVWKVISRSMHGGYLQVHIEIHEARHIEYPYGSCNFYNSRSLAKHSPERSKRRRVVKRILQGEFRKSRPPNFDGEDKIGKEAEAWLLAMETHFKIHGYTKNEKDRISIFTLNVRSLIW